MASSLAFNPAGVRSSPIYSTIRSSQAEGPLRRPSVPVREATPPLSARPSPPDAPPSPTTPAPAPAPAPSSFVTVEYQRQRARELQQYFQDRKAERQAAEGRIFGWSVKNEIGNGRWAMFGVAVGLLTEYATGSDFVDQMKIIISNLGIADLE
ncbi:hypothetical protein GOP47_0012954 [Adiantum capillus-veneris]|uniref:Uncharacterized protein n=1 Tax=Adiantum capillus-veneris TaxID=13818 RepID=A0A9D4URN2_ADICA|nr:hypothetical protein GOP47_0012388 [Adiantum capillus-veneris]KAI5072848.1 hypothetical protein GOP47_0012954 [Adiantum capillus-veneris]